MDKFLPSKNWYYTFFVSGFATILKSNNFDGPGHSIWDDVVRWLYGW